MGEPTPDEKPPWPPYLEPDKFYCVLVVACQEIGCTGDCAGDQCCTLGAAINTWSVDGGGCSRPFGLCITSVHLFTSLRGVSGPYDDLDECWEVC